MRNNETGRPTANRAASGISDDNDIVDRFCCLALDLIERNRLAAAGATCGPDTCARGELARPTLTVVGGEIR